MKNKVTASPVYTYENYVKKCRKLILACGMGVGIGNLIAWIVLFGDIGSLLFLLVFSCVVSFYGYESQRMMLRNDYTANAKKEWSLVNNDRLVGFRYKGNWVKLVKQEDKLLYYCENGKLIEIDSVSKEYSLSFENHEFSIPRVEFLEERFEDNRFNSVSVNCNGFKFQKKIIVHVDMHDVNII